MYDLFINFGKKTLDMYFLIERHDLTTSYRSVSGCPVAQITHIAFITYIACIAVITFIAYLLPRVRRA